MNPRVLFMRVDLELSQLIWLHAEELEVNIAVNFENAGPSPVFVRGFDVYSIIRRFGLLTRKESIAGMILINVSNGGKRVDLDAGLRVEPGISPRYFLQIRIVPFVRLNQRILITMEPLGHSRQTIEVIPDWERVILNQLLQKNVRHVKYYD